MMLPLKWKIFRIISYLHMVCTLGMGTFALYSIFNSRIRFHSAEDVLSVLIFIFCPSILLANSSINIYLLERFYPDRLSGKKLQRFSVLLFILSLLVVIAVVLLTIAGFSESLSGKNYTFRQGFMVFLTLSGFAVIGVTGLYIIVGQVSLRRTIRRNQEAALNSFLNDDPAQGI